MDEVILDLHQAVDRLETAHHLTRRVGRRARRQPGLGEMAEVCADAYREVAPKSLVATLDARPPEEIPR